MGSSAGMRVTSEMAMRLSGAMEEFAEKNDDAAASLEKASFAASCFFEHLDCTLAGSPKGPPPGGRPSAPRSRSRGRGRGTLPPPPAAAAAAGAAANPTAAAGQRPPAGSGHLPPGLTTAGPPASRIESGRDSGGPGGIQDPLSEVLFRAAVNRPPRVPSGIQD